MPLFADRSLLGSPAGLMLVCVVFLLLYVWRRRRTYVPPTNEVADPRRQLEFVSRVQFETRPLLNKSEFQILAVLDDVVRDLGEGYRVMAQTSLGEFIRPKRGLSAADNDLAYRSINSKRADFVIVDSSGYAVLVVEYQGGGHYQGTALLRDAVKREAFRTAGVALIEVPANSSKAETAKQVRQILEKRPKRPAASRLR
jgi:hypothetical protein